MHKRSKYDTIVDRFLEAGHGLVEISVKGKSPSYVAGKLNKRIQAKGLELKVTTVSDVVYLEKSRPHFITSQDSFFFKDIFWSLHSMCLAHVYQ